MIHGYPLNRQIWRSQWEGLANSARMIAPDLRNHGETRSWAEQDLSESIHSMDLLAEDLAQLLDTLRISQPGRGQWPVYGGLCRFRLLS